MRVPPRIVRRLVIAPLVVAVELVVIVLSPVLLLAGALASPLAGGWRPLRVVALALVAAAHHAAAIVACLGLWVASGFGLRMRGERMQHAHYALMRWFVRGVYDVIVAVARVRIEVTGSGDGGAVLGAHQRPALLLGRHAGEGDTLLVLYELLVPHRRRPRVVMHERLRLEPLIDVLGHRLPNRFVDPRGGDTERDIAELARTLDDDSALVIFPEGHNFSEARRRRAIERLERAGYEWEAQVAAAMQRVSAPRPGGALAAIEAAPDADVVVLGHAGFPDGLRDVWRHLPAEQVIEVRLWHERASTLPRERDARIHWLFERWQELDAWVSEREP